MPNKRTRISNAIKEQILLESYNPKCDITELASKHGVTAKRIYNWRSEKRKQSQSPVTQAIDNFIELVANDQKSLPTPIAIEYVQTELKFADFSFSIQGKISNKKLHKIIELMGSVC